MTPPNWGQSLTTCMKELSRYLNGWVAHFRLCTEEAALMLTPRERAHFTIGWCSGTTMSPLIDALMQTRKRILGLGTGVAGARSLGGYPTSSRNETFSDLCYGGF
jgi:hypothetical protein